MAVATKPRTCAFVLKSEMSEKFFNQKEHTSEKLFERAASHKTKSSLVRPSKDGSRL